MSLRPPRSDPISAVNRLPTADVVSLTVLDLRSSERSPQRSTADDENDDRMDGGGRRAVAQGGARGTRRGPRSALRRREGRTVLPLDPRCRRSSTACFPPGCCGRCSNSFPIPAARSRSVWPRYCETSPPTSKGGVSARCERASEAGRHRAPVRFSRPCQHLSSWPFRTSDLLCKTSRRYSWEMETERGHARSLSSWSGTHRGSCC